MLKKNKYREAHPEWFDEKGRPHVWVLRELINYDPVMGQMVWRERADKFFLPCKNNLVGYISPSSSARRWNKRFAGGMAGTISVNPDGFKSVNVTIFDRRFSALSVVYAITKGSWHNGNVSTVDGNPINLRGGNISTSFDVLPQKRREYYFFNRRGLSQFVGVYFDASKKRWGAHITVGKRMINLGRFKVEDEAAAAYDRAALLHFGKGAYTNDVELPDPAQTVAPKPTKPARANKRKLKSDDF